MQLKIVENGLVCFLFFCVCVCLCTRARVCVCVCVCVFMCGCVSMYVCAYHIAGNFRGTKFSRMAPKMTICG